MPGKTDYDLCVLGGGAAGLVVAAGGATLGAKVLLIDKQARLGGDCLYTGCVPSKALLHRANTAQTLRMAGAKPAADAALTQAMIYVRSVIAQIEPNDSPDRFRDMGVEIMTANAAFHDPRTLDAAGRSIRARRFVLATGSSPLVPPIPGLDNVPYLTNETVFELSSNIESLIVLGAGPIGMEMAQAFARLGTRVSVVDMAPRVLPQEDQDLSQVVRQQLEQEGVTFYLDHRAQRVAGKAGDIHLTLQATGTQGLELKASHMLVATGRRSNTAGLGLEQAGVALDAHGHLQLDRRLRTSNKRIYACGDVAGPYQFTHMAEHQAGVVLRNALFHLPAKSETRVIPWCTFTTPELARVGLSEDQAKAQGLAYQVHRFPFADIDRAHTEAATQGFVKVLIDRRGHILGAAIVGQHAGELIHEYVLAMAKRIKLAELSGVIHIYPTLAQINRRVADSMLKQRLTPNSKKWMQWIFRLRGN